MRIVEALRSLSLPGRSTPAAVRLLFLVALAVGMPFACAEREPSDSGSVGTAVQHLEQSDGAAGCLGGAASPSDAGAGHGGVQEPSPIASPSVGGTTGDVMGFESATLWSTTSGSLSTSDDRVQGEHALSVTGGGWRTIQSVAVACPPVTSDRLSYWLKLPYEQPNPGWYGTIELRLEAPSIGVWETSLGALDLNGLPLGTYLPFEHQLPADVYTKLLASPCDDLRFTLALNVPWDAPGEYLFDDLRFGSGGGAGTGGAGGSGGGDTGGSGGTNTGGTATGGMGDTGGTGGTGGEPSGGTGGEPAGGTGGETGGTGGETGGTAGTGGTGGDPNAELIEFFIQLPEGVTRREVVFDTYGGDLSINDRVDVVSGAGKGTVASVSGGRVVRVGVEANVGDTYSDGSVSLTNRTHVFGDVISSGAVTREPDTIVDGTVSEYTSLGEIRTIRWKVPFPTEGLGSVTFGSTLEPGDYGDASVKTGNHLKLTTGTYTFRKLELEPGASLEIDNILGPVHIYVRTGGFFRGTIDRTVPEPNVLFGFAGTEMVDIGDSGFTGLIVAPWGELNFATTQQGHRGAFFARKITVHQATTITHEPLDPSDVCGLGDECNGLCPCSGGGPCESDGDCLPALECVDGFCGCNVDCSARDCGEPAATACEELCTGLCDMHEAGCTRNSDCPDGAICGIAVGERFGHAPGANVCMDPACLVVVPTEPNCGAPAGVDCGICPACVPACDGTTTGPDGCGGFCGECEDGEERMPSGYCAPIVSPVSDDGSDFPIPLDPLNTQEVGSLPGSFAVSDRGTATYSIPLQVPPGRMGMQPNLSFNYESTRKQGIMGLGWQLGGLSRVTRCQRTVGRDDVAAPVRMDDNDRFCLDGKLLVEVDRHADGSREYRTEVDSFARVVAHGPFFDGSEYIGPRWFEVFAKDGRILHYGSRAQNYSSVHVGERLKRVWAVDWIQDRPGNGIAIHYKESKSWGWSFLPGSPEPGEETGELVPQMIAYADRTIEFDYQSAADWQHHYVAGSLAFAHRRLARVRVYAQEDLVWSYRVDYEDGRPDLVSGIRHCAPDPVDGSEKCKPATTFEYGENAGLGQEQVEAACATRDAIVLDANGDGRDDVLFKTGPEGYSLRLSAGAGPDFETVTGGLQGASSRCISQNSVVDVDHDGRDELLDLCGGGVFEYVDGQGYVPDEYLLAVFYDNPIPDYKLIADVNGDGFKDVIGCGSGTFTGQLRVYLGHQYGFSHEPSLDTPTVEGEFCDKVRPIDFDGDGAEEILFQDPDDERYPEVSGPIVLWDAEDATWRVVADLASNDFLSNEDELITWDINSDGLPDLLHPFYAWDGNALYFWAYFNTGHSFEGHLFLGAMGLDPADHRTLHNLLSSPYGPDFSVNGVPNRPSGRFFGVFDQDGDGRDELVTRIGSLRMSNVGHALVFEPAAAFPAQPILADVDGDGATDILSHGFYCVRGENSTLRRSGNASTNLLRRVTDGLGKRVDVEYDAWGTDALGMPERTAKIAGCTSGFRTKCVRRVAPVVSEHRESQVSSNVEQSEATYRYKYRGARVFNQGRGWLGFEERSITRVGRWQRTLRYDMGVEGEGWSYLLVGRLIEDTKRYRIGPLVPALRVEHTTYSWALNQADKLPHYPYVYQRIDDLFEGSSEPVWQSVLTRDAMDGWGNAFRESVSESVGDVEVSSATIHRNLGNWSTDWLLGLVYETEITSTRGFETETRTTAFDYDDNGLLELVIREPGSLQGDEIEQTQYRRTDLARNAYGQLQAACTVDGRGDLHRRCSGVVEWDEASLFPRRVSSGASDFDLSDGLESVVSHSSRTGQLLVARDPNGRIGERAFDAFGRPRQVLTPESRGEYSYSVAYPTSSPFADISSFATTAVTASFDGEGKHTVALDAFGRVAKTLTEGMEERLVISELMFNNGRLVAETLPHAINDATQGFFSYAYDAADRIINVTSPDDNETTYDYFNHTNCADVSTCNTNWFADSETLYPLVAGGSVMRADGRRHVLISDHHGNPSKSIQAAGTPEEDYNRYYYGAFDDLTFAEAPGYVVTEVVTDRLGRVQLLDDPSLGGREYSYNGFDELTETRAPNGQITRRFYDRRGRLTTLSDGDDSLVARWIYDGLGPNEMGRLVAAYRRSAPGSSTGNWVRYSYQTPPASGQNRGLLEAVHYGIGGDAANQLSGEVFTVGLERSAPQVPWRVDAVHYPSTAAAGPFTVRYDFDPAGYMESVDSAETGLPYWTRVETDSGLRISKERFGNDVYTTRSFFRLGPDGIAPCDIATDHSCLPGELENIHTQYGDLSSSPILQDSTFAYNRIGQVKRITEAAPEGRGQSFIYDNLDRLLERYVTDSGTDVLEESFAYNALGNITHRGGSPNFALGNYAYSQPFNPTAVTAVGGGATNGGTTYGYDNNGNQTSREGAGVPGGRQTLTYNDFDMPSLVETGPEGNAIPTHLEYDAHGTRLVKSTYQAGTSPGDGQLVARTLDLGELYQQVAEYSGGTPTAVTHHYRVYAAGRQVAEVTRDEQGGSITESTTYLHANHLGSPEVVTDQNGDAQRREFSAFGEVSNSSGWASSVIPGFTGHAHDFDLGLVNMRGRLYDARLGRFMTPDPFVTEPLSTQGLNRYSYVQNDPVNWVDPSGFDGEPDRSGQEVGPPEIHQDIIMSTMTVTASAPGGPSSGGAATPMPGIAGRDTRASGAGVASGGPPPISGPEPGSAPSGNVPAASTPTLAAPSPDAAPPSSKTAAGPSSTEGGGETGDDPESRYPGCTAGLCAPQAYGENIEAFGEATTQIEDTSASLELELAVLNLAVSGVEVTLAFSAMRGAAALRAAAGLADDAAKGTAGAAARAAAPAADDVAMAAGEAAPPVIGHMGDIPAVAARHGGAVFTGNGLSGKALVQANQAFLEGAIQAGQSFRLATPISTARQGSMFEAELMYIIQSGRGYLPNATGTLLVPGRF